jgi:hypothetical protein
LGEIKNRANELVCGYVFGKYGDPNDAGMYYEWEAEVDGDPAKMNG